MDKINNNLFAGYTEGEKLLADKLNGLIDGLNNVIIPKINELVDDSKNQENYQVQLANQLNTVANSINALATEVQSQQAQIDNIDVPNTAINTAILYHRSVFLSIDYVSPMMFLTDHEVAIVPTAFLTDRETWRIDPNGNFQDTEKQNFYYNKDEIANKLNLYAVKTSENTSEYPTVEKVGPFLGTTVITYPRGDASCYEEDGTQKIDKSKPVKEGSYSYSLNWKWNHGITPVNPDTYRKDIAGLDYVALANVPTLYDVFAGSELHAGSNAPYKNRILDEYYGGQETTLSSWYGDLAFTTADWWWTTGTDHTRFGWSSNTHRNRNIDNFDSISDPSGVHAYEYYWVTKDIYIADGATIQPYNQYRVGDDVANTVQQMNSTVGIPQNLDTLTTDVDLGSLTGPKQYVAIRPRMDAILAGLHFVLPGSGWGGQTIDWNDFASHPQQYVDQYLGKTVWPGPDSENNQRDQICDLDTELYYGGASASIWEQTGVNKNTEVYCTTGYSEGQYFYGSDKVGYTYFKNHMDAIASQMKRTKYECVSRMYYWNDGNISVDYPNSSITTTQYKFWCAGPVRDYGAHSLSYNQKLKAGDIFIVLCNPHSKSISVSAIKGNLDLKVTRTGSFTLNTGMDSQQSTWSAETGYGSGFTTAKEIMNCTNAGVFKNINVPCEDIIGDHHHDTQTLLQSDPQSPFLYKRYGGRDYTMYAYQVGEDMSLLQLNFWPYYD